MDAPSPLDPAFLGEIEVKVGEGVVLVLRQMDGVMRMALAVQADVLSDSIGEGADIAADFALAAGPAPPVDEETVQRVRRYQIEMTLALQWGLVDIKGADWPFERASLARLVRYGDPELGVPPLYLALGGWLRGPLREIAAAGERSGVSSDGDTEEASLSATAAPPSANAPPGPARKRPSAPARRLH